MQTMIVGAIVLVAAALLASRLWRSVRCAKDKGKGCGKGCKCG